MAVVDVDMQIVEDAEENYQVRGEQTHYVLNEYTTTDKADRFAPLIADLARTDWVSVKFHVLCLTARSICANATQHYEYRHDKDTKL